ncbi:hypothetical protein [Rubritalea sp.]|uniref:hypothetical protein n=1 Tax=Rubritalea sp. TaxID=2109375 RepID=UPI003F4A86E5
MDRSEYWIRFVCGFIVLGLLSFFSIFKWIESVDLWGIVGYFLTLLGTCHYAAKHGDDAWRSLLGWFHWW